VVLFMNKGMKKKLLLLRHAEHEAAHLHQFIGSTDIGLSELGRSQAASVVSFIKGYRPSRYFCSPLKRCLETIQPLQGISIEINPDLREVDFGSWERKTFDQIQTLDPEIVNQWADFSPAFSFPGGERLEDFLIRIQRAASAITSCSEDTILAATHAGVIRALLCHFLGLDPRQYVLFNVDYGSLTVLDLFGDKGVLTGLNHSCFSEGSMLWDKSF
jgi:alpha-ribazole phosphatase